MIIVDATTSYHFRSWKPMGILRVELEGLRAFREAFGDDVTFVVYRPELQAFFRIENDEIDRVLAEGRWYIPPVRRAETSPSRLERHRRRFRLLRDIRRIGKRRAETGQAEHEQRLLMAGAVAKVSSAEYGSLRFWTRRLLNFDPGLARAFQIADHVNHLLHHEQYPEGEEKRFALDRMIDLSRIDAYVSLGAFWSDDRQQVIWQARKAHGFSLHCLIYDLIPVYWRHVCEPTTKETFPQLLHWVLWGVDQIWTISETTKRDLVRFMRESGYPELPDDRITPILLGADAAPKQPSAEDFAAVLDRYDLEAGGFALMVGTLEPRKNHRFAYELWREMHLRKPGQVIPLVCVGQVGWKMEGFAEMVGEDSALPQGAIRFLTDVDDDALNALYSACRFAIYPSYYEGWGLPVIEALNRGKPCLTSTAPSIIEAARGAADCLPLTEPERWIARAFDLMHDDKALTRAEERARAFDGYRWRDFRAALTADFSAYQDSLMERPISRRKVV